MFFLTNCNQEKTVENKPAAVPPKAIKKDTILSMHGHERIDPYYWLRERENPEVIAYLEADNAYADAMMANEAKNADAFFVEIKQRIKEDDNSVPYFNKGYWHYRRYETGMEYGLMCRKKESLDAAEEVVINQNDYAKGHSYYSIGGMAYSPNQAILAYAEDTVGRRQYTIKFKSLEGSTQYPEVIELIGGMSWANDNKTFFYVKIDPITLRSYRVYKHLLGTPTTEDVLVYEEKNEQFSVSIGKSKSDKYIIIQTSSTLSDEAMLINADKPNDLPKVFHPRTANLEYAIDHLNNQFYIRTNYNANNFCIMTCGENQTQLKHWKIFVKHDENVLNEGFELFNGKMVVEERTNGLTQMRILNEAGKELKRIDFGEAAYTAGLEINVDPNLDYLRFYYTSLTTPASTISYNLATDERTVLKESPVLGKFDKNDYETKRLFATASDGTKIPISIVYHKKTALDGTAPSYLYGYGSYGSSMDPSFSTARLSLLNRGFVYALFHVRGGQEMGRDWYNQGKFLQKKNTFTDFIACTQYLIDQKLISSQKVVASGGSAGGLLMGAIINMAPQLYHTVVADVPFVDVVTTMLDASIPLTTGEYEEWGNPEDKVYYDYMLSYSPYDQVKAQNYPNLLVTTGLHDSQVQYWEPAKWVAKLRDLKTDQNLLLLKTNMDAGHGGASGRFESLKEIAFEYSFIFKTLGLKPF